MTMTIERMENVIAAQSIAYMIGHAIGTALRELLS